MTDLAGGDIGHLSWIRWPDHWNHRDIGHPGVYLLAKISGALPVPVDCLDQRIIYIGETTRQTLEKRLREFRYSAFQGKPKHSGRFTFFVRLLSGQPGSEPQWLCVALVPIKIPEPRRRTASIHCLKQSLIEQFRDKWNRRPECNTR